MNCYDFELNISAYIDGELKQAIRADIIRHEEICPNCAKKLNDIISLVKNMPEMIKLKTSSHFISKLQNRIKEIDNRGPSLLDRLSQINLFGFEPIPAVGFAMAIIMIVGAAFLFFNQDGLPEVDFEKLSTQTQEQAPKQALPSVINPDRSLPSMADSDSSAKLEKREHSDKPIHLVGGNK